MKPADGVSVIAMVLIASFAIDRIVAAFLFPFAFLPSFPQETEKRYKLLYFLVAAMLAVIVLAWVGNMRVLDALGLQPNPTLDFLVTGIVLIGGADKIAGALKPPGAPSSQPERKQQVEVSGTVHLAPGDQLPKHR
jgi:hypothetical protein